MKDLINENNKIILPVVKIYEEWLRSDKLELNIFPNDVLDPNKIIVVDSVKVGSEFYFVIKKELSRFAGVVEFVIGIDELYYGKDIVISELYNQVHFTFLVYKKISPEILLNLKVYTKYIHHMKFVVVARKDWSFENTYRSLPDFVREKTYVDFPPSLTAEDFFYSELESQRLRLRLGQYYKTSPLKSYSPWLRIKSQLNDDRLVDVMIKKIQRKQDSHFEEPKDYDEKLRKRYRRQEVMSVFLNFIQLNPLISILASIKFFINHAVTFYVRSPIRSKTINLLGIIKHFILKNLWRISPQTLGWLLYRILFPIRKIYYFLSYQYGKRILKKTKGLPKDSA